MNFSAIAVILNYLRSWPALVLMVLGVAIGINGVGFQREGLYQCSEPGGMIWLLSYERGVISGSCAKSIGHWGSVRIAQLIGQGKCRNIEQAVLKMGGFCFEVDP